MDLIWEKFTEWLKELLVGGIMDNLTGLFDNVNAKVAEAAGHIGSTPQAWNANIYSMIRSLSDNLILPIAGVILAFVMTLELIQLIADRNNLHDIDTWATRCCSASPCSKPAVSQSQFSTVIDGGTSLWHTFPYPKT